MLRIACVYESFFRGISIVWVVLRYGLDELVLSSFQHPWLRALTRIITIGRSLDARAAAPAQALESLGPIFVKFGQVLSTRRDLMPPTSPTNWRCCRIACRHSIPTLPLPP